MNITSILFILVALPTLLVFYNIVKNIKIRNIILILFSIFFYCWGDILHFPVIASISLITYFLGIFLEKSKKNYWWISYVLLIPLVLYKTILNSFPLGISFFSFQCVAYLIDVGTRKYHAEKNVLNLFLFCLFFPVVTCGPILRYDDFSLQLTTREVNFEKTRNGLIRFIYGLGKKIILADNLGLLVSRIADMRSGSETFIIAWISAIAFTIQLYLDFSSYSDMAVGISEMLGFRIKENFNRPFISKNLTEFWRRWHISLGNWFKDYVYIPLGGNRKGSLRRDFNLLAVWLFTGFWHGVNYTYIIWGLILYSAILIEKRIKINNIVYSNIMIVLSFVFFKSDSISRAFISLKSMFMLNGIGSISSLVYLDLLFPCCYLFVAIIFVMFESLGCFSVFKKKYPVISDISLIVILLVSLYFIENASYSPFLYAKF